MNNLSVVVAKILLSSFSAITIFLSSLLIVLIFNLWLQEGIPPFENIKFSIALFFTIMMMLVICQCLKYYTDMATDRRNHLIKQKLTNGRIRNDDVRV